MKIENTTYGKRITIPETLNNSEFVYNLRNVRTINNNDPNEQPLINELEQGERIAERKLIILLYSMENFFRTATTGEAYDQWEQHNRMDWNEYYHEQIRTLAEQVNNYSFEYAELRNYGNTEKARLALHTIGTLSAFELTYAPLERMND